MANVVKKLEKQNISSQNQSLDLTLIEGSQSQSPNQFNIGEGFFYAKPTIKILDLFCGIGGASLGYARACEKLNIDYQIVGIDKNKKLASIYPYHFINCDAVEFLKGYAYIRDFDFIHASPPCQKYSKSTSMHRSKGKQYADLVPIVQELLRFYQIPYCIENVLEADIRPDLFLRADMFGLRTLKKRKFELSFFMMQPGIPRKKGSVKLGDFAQIVGEGQFVSQNSKIKFKYSKEKVLDTWKEVLQIPQGSNCHQLAEAIPPAYTQYIFEYYLETYFLKKWKYQTNH